MDNFCQTGYNTHTHIYIYINVCELIKVCTNFAGGSCKDAGRGSRLRNCRGNSDHEGTNACELSHLYKFSHMSLNLNQFW